LLLQQLEQLIKIIRFIYCGRANGTVLRKY